MLREEEQKGGINHRLECHYYCSLALLCTQSKGVKIVVTGGYYINLVEFRGNSPAMFGQQGEFVRPLLRGGADSPNNVSEKRKKKAGVLDMACGHLASASKFNSDPVGARGNASRGRVLLIPPNGSRVEEYTPI